MSKFAKFQLLLFFCAGVISAFYGGYYFGKRGFVFEVRKNPPKIEITNKFPTDQNVDFALFWEVWDRLNAKYLERPLDAQKLVYGAIDGMVQALDDPYTSFLDPEMNELSNNSLNGVYEGIGAELGMREGQLIVVSPLDGSPAQEAGVQAQDAILEIDGESTAGKSITQAVYKIRGTSGTQVTLTLARPNLEPFDVTITRGVIKSESVTWEDKGDGTIYIRISRFGGDTNATWTKVVSEINAQTEELDAIVLDVRGNPGGYLLSAVYIAEEFYRNAPVLFQENSVGDQNEFTAERVGAFDKVPAVYVLINEGSASASEILAAALRDNISAQLIGEKSFGKGTIQGVEDFKDGSGLHITIAKWLTPKKEWIHKIGLTPDHIVEMTAEDITQGDDPQLDKALELADSI